MHPPLGLSIGTTNFVAATADREPVVRRSLLTLPAEGSPQLGSSADGTGGTENGRPIDGFVDCVGERTKLVAADGSARAPEPLLADAIEAMVDAAGAAGSQLAIAVPAHWPPAAWQALQGELQNRAGLSSPGAPPFLVSDAVAALTALQADRGVAVRGVVVLLDFGGGGTNISLADAASGFQPIGETVRYRQFSGNLIDQTIVSYIVGGTDQGGGGEPNGTATVGDLAQLIDECRQAKERLSADAATELVAALPGYNARVALTRAELEDLIRGSVDGVIAALEETLRRNGIDWHDLAAIATVGGGARIPLITERLSAGHQVPVITSRLPTLAMAVGAALCAAADTPHGPGVAVAATAGGDAPPTTLAPPVTLAGATRGSVAADPSVVDELAWSKEETRDGDEPAPFFGERYSAPAPSPARIGPEKARRSHRVPQLVFGFAALAAMIGVGGVTYALTGASHGRAPAGPAGDSAAQVAPPGSRHPGPAQAAAPPNTAPGPGGSAAPSPAATTSTAPPPATTTTTAPTTTSTTSTTTTTTTTATTATTTPATSTTTTAATPTTTTAPSNSVAATSSGVPMATEYLTLPLVPMPIPIQVPAN